MRKNFYDIVEYEGFNFTVEGEAVYCDDEEFGSPFWMPEEYNISLNGNDIYELLNQETIDHIMELVEVNDD